MLTFQIGFCGKWVVHQLLQRGESPSAIRILDLRHPSTIGDAVGTLRGASKFNVYEPVQTAVESVGFVKTDITDYDSVRNAFLTPWPKGVEDKELTVIHSAAVIRHWERRDCFLDRVAKVNTDGTRNVVKAAQEAGATILVATSSGSVGVRRPQIWTPPWRKWPVNYAQVFNDCSKNMPTKKEDFFANYSWSKYNAEKFVREADMKGGMRTGIIRPGNGIFGPGGDFTAGLYMQIGGGLRSVTLQVLP